MTKKIMDMLSKYKSEDWCMDVAINIDNNIQDTIKQLKNIQENLSHIIFEINLSDKLEDEIINDIQNDIKIIKQLIIHFAEMKQNISTITDKKNKRKIFDSNIKIFIIDDILCPECNVKLYPLCIDYQKNINGIIEYEMVNIYECQCCKKMFAMQYDIENINLSNTNIILDYRYLKNECQLIFNDVIVLSNLISCTSKGHNLNDISAQIPVFAIDGSINFIDLNISYCNSCNKYIMLKQDFKQIDGIVACKVIDQTINKDRSNIDEIEIKQSESLLYQYGYNVKTKDNLSDRQRHLILASVVESGILTRAQICSHLDTLIERGNKIEKWKLATQKWKQDRQYVKRYNVKNLPDILLNKIVLKYSQYNQLSLDI